MYLRFILEYRFVSLAILRSMFQNGTNCRFLQLPAFKNVFQVG